MSPRITTGFELAGAGAHADRFERHLPPGRLLSARRRRRDRRPRALARRARTTFESSTRCRRHVAPRTSRRSRAHGSPPSAPPRRGRKAASDIRRRPWCRSGRSTTHRTATGSRGGAAGRPSTPVESCSLAAVLPLTGVAFRESGDGLERCTIRRSRSQSFRPGDRSALDAAARNPEAHVRGSRPGISPPERARDGSDRRRSTRWTSPASRACRAAPAARPNGRRSRAMTLPTPVRTSSRSRPQVTGRLQLVLVGRVRKISACALTIRRRRARHSWMGHESRPVHHPHRGDAVTESWVWEPSTQADPS